MKSRAKNPELFDMMRCFARREVAIRYVERIRRGDHLHCVREGVDKITEQKKVGQCWGSDCRQSFSACTEVPLERHNLDPPKGIHA